MSGPYDQAFTALQTQNGLQQHQPIPTSQLQYPSEGFSNQYQQPYHKPSKLLPRHPWQRLPGATALRTVRRQHLNTINNSQTPTHKAPEADRGLPRRPPAGWPQLGAFRRPQSRPRRYSVPLAVRSSGSLTEDYAKKGKKGKSTASTVSTGHGHRDSFQQSRAGAVGAGGAWLCGRAVSSTGSRLAWLDHGLLFE